MSQNKAAKRFKTPKSDCLSARIQLNEVQTILNSLISPIALEIAALSRIVSNILKTINKTSDSEKVTKNCEFASSNIAADVAVMVSSMHRLNKNCESIKEQVIENQKNIENFYGKLSSIEKLLATFLKVENNRSVKQAGEQTFEKLSTLEPVEGFSTKPDSVSSQLPDNCKDFEDDSYIPMDSPPPLITLNNEDSLDNGSWLGDFSSIKHRVRCPIPEEDLIYVNTTCATPEKMALTLLDLLFTRETLAKSNLTGRGKLGKKKLNPKMIYGIKCHLMYHFKISDKQWEEIKLKIDSKCRYARMKKKSRGSTTQVKLIKSINKSDDDKKETEDPKLIEAIKPVLVQGLNTQVIHTLPGNIGVLQTTPDQILIHNIQNESYLLPVIGTSVSVSNNALPLSSNKEEGVENLTVISTTDTDLHGTDAVSFVTEPMLDEFTEEDALKIETSALIEEE